MSEIRQYGAGFCWFAPEPKEMKFEPKTKENETMKNPEELLSFTVAAAEANQHVNTIYADLRSGALKAYFEKADGFGALTCLQRVKEGKPVGPGFIFRSDIEKRYGKRPEVGPKVPPLTKEARAAWDKHAQLAFDSPPFSPPAKLEFAQDVEGSLEVAFVVGRACENAPTAILERLASYIAAELAERGAK